MSSRATAWAWLQIEQGGVSTSSAALVLLKLADRADPRRGECWPGLETLALDTSMSRATIARAIGELRNANLICITKRTDARGLQASNLYTLQLDQQPETSECMPAREAQRTHRPDPVTRAKINALLGRNTGVSN